MSEKKSADSILNNAMGEPGIDTTAGPRVTEDQIVAAIEGIDYALIPDSTLTICVLHLKNGIKVVGESACVSKENFDEQTGREMAYADAFNKCWQMFGFHLASVLTGWKMDE